MKKGSSSANLDKDDESEKLLENSIPNLDKDDESEKLLEKYEILDNFFNRLDTLVSWYRMNRWTPTFTSISSGIESLTNMRFTHTHLAQLKYILPDGIVLEKHIGFDKRTSTMKQDILISLDRDALDRDAVEADYYAVDVDPLDLDEVEAAKSLERRRRLRKVFRSRLRDFQKSHPKGDDIPEGTLPEPFNRPKEDILEPHLPTFPRRTRYTVNNAGSRSAELGESVELPIEDVAAPGKFSRPMRYIVKNAVSESPNLGESAESPHLGESAESPHLGESAELPTPKAAPSESPHLGESAELPTPKAAPSDTPSLRAGDVELPTEDLADN